MFRILIAFSNSNAVALTVVEFENRVAADLSIERINSTYTSGATLKAVPLYE